MANPGLVAGIIRDSALAPPAFPLCGVSPEPVGIDALRAIQNASLVTGAGSVGTQGDLNCDARVDPRDFPPFVDCISGPGGAVSQGICANADFNEPWSSETNQPDGDVDMYDLLQLQASITGYDTGACCHLDGSCSETSPVACGQEFGATWQGPGTMCPSTCTPQPVGACCTNGNCTQTTSASCAGLYYGDNSSCPAACPTIVYQDTADLGYTPSDRGMKIADDLEPIQGSGLLTFVRIGVKGGGGCPFNVSFELWTGPPCSGGAPIPGTSWTWSNVPDGGPQYLQHTFDSPVQLPAGKVWGVWTFSTPQAGCVIRGASSNRV